VGLLAAVPLASWAAPRESGEPARPRLRSLGITIGALPTGPLNAITDVAGVRVGHVSLIRGGHVRTGVTAVVPHDGNVYRDKVPAALFVGNGFGKLAGATQIAELGTLETPILLCGTLNVHRVADALVSYMLGRPGMEDVVSINPVVGETNDGALNDIRGRHVGEREVFEAIASASSGPVAEGTVGAGVGTRCMGFKGGIGTSSRLVQIDRAGTFTLGVLVQTNFGGSLVVAGAPVGREMRRRLGRDAADRGSAAPAGDGSCMIVVATDAPLEARNLRRLAARAIAGMARTGASLSNGSGDYVIAFSTAEDVRVHSRGGDRLREGPHLGNDSMSPLFVAAMDATEEAIVNSLLRATTVTNARGPRSEAVPIDLLVESCRQHGVIRPE
jgi:D-aminopeptidase